MADEIVQREQLAIALWKTAPNPSEHQGWRRWEDVDQGYKEKFYEWADHLNFVLSGAPEVDRG